MNAATARAVDLQAVAVEYLAVRRALGYRLDGVDRTLERFTAAVTASGGLVTIGGCLDWVMTQGNPPGCNAARRLAVIRGFARYLQAIDPAHQTPPTRLIHQPTSRPTPRLYSDDEIVALMAAAATLEPSSWATTIETMIGLLWATGMRAGELLRLNIADLDPATGALTIRLAKFNKTRLVPLDVTTIAALTRYRTTARTPDRFTGEQGALFTTRTGTRVDYGRFKTTFNLLAAECGISDPGGGPPRLHTMRHSFAVRTLLDWYRQGVDVQAMLPRLSTYLGHVEPASTYWYLTAAPELMALVAERIDRNQRDRDPR